MQGVPQGILRKLMNIARAEIVFGVAIGATADMDLVGRAGLEVGFTEVVLRLVGRVVTGEEVTFQQRDIIVRLVAS